jgi:hypothetical protein
MIFHKMDDELELSNFPAITSEDLEHDRRLNFMIVENWTRTKSTVKNYWKFQMNLICEFLKLIL